MITASIKFCNNMINALPAGDGISDTLSPATIVTGRVAPNVANLQLHFGDFVQLQMAKWTTTPPTPCAHATSIASPFTPLAPPKACIILWISTQANDDMVSNRLGA